MGSKYPVLPPYEIIAALISVGFAVKSQKGSHVKLVKVLTNGPTRTAIVPLHDEVARGTLKSILIQSGLTLDEFMRIINR